jgi:hypothetical protein
LQMLTTPKQGQKSGLCSHWSLSAVSSLQPTHTMHELWNNM